MERGRTAFKQGNPLPPEHPASIPAPRTAGGGAIAWTAACGPAALEGAVRARAPQVAPCGAPARASGRPVGVAARTGYHCASHAARAPHPWRAIVPIQPTPAIVTQPAAERPRVPTITVGLRPHPASPDADAPGKGPVGRLLATMFALPEGGAVFEFRLEESHIGRLAIPAARPSAAAADLWRHTCFEVFLGAPGEPGYREYNFSPSGEWAVYAFRGWRDRIGDFAAAAAPEVRCAQSDDTLVLEARVPAELLPAVPAGSDLQASLAAVIERRDGALEYWALRHLAAQPDFHARETFVLALATAARKAD